MNENNLDILKKLEDLSSKVNVAMDSKTKTVFERYPITFALFVLLGVSAVSEGIKGILESINLGGHPWYMLIIGLVILLITGRVYKKLDK